MSWVSKKRITNCKVIINNVGLEKNNRFNNRIESLLLYLHSSVSKQILHNNVPTSNKGSYIIIIKLTSQILSWNVYTFLSSALESALFWASKRVLTPPHQLLNSYNFYIIKLKARYCTLQRINLYPASWTCLPLRRSCPCCWAFPLFCSHLLWAFLPSVRSRRCPGCAAFANLPENKFKII